MCKYQHIEVCVATAIDRWPELNELMPSGIYIWSQQCIVGARVLRISTFVVITEGSCNLLGRWLKFCQYFSDTVRLIEAIYLFTQYV